MGLLQKLRTYLVLIPIMLFFNFLNRIKYYLSLNSTTPGASALTKDWAASNKMVAAVMRGAKFQATLEAEKGGPAIDVDLYDLVGKKSVKLFDFVKENRPLVVNFGSCT